jgi:DNA-binding transcriptional regulator YiaG
MQILHAEMALSREKFDVQKSTLGRAIRRLRSEILRVRFQKEMAASLGVSLDVYRNWENGRSLPDAVEMLTLLSFCPEDEMRGLFGLKSQISDLKSPAPQPAKATPRKLPAPQNEEQEQILRLYSDAAQGLDFIWEAAMAGEAGAKTLLADLADKLTTRGGDWRRIKYLKFKRGE